MRLNVHRLLRLLVAIAVPPVWAEIAVLHYRGSFQSRFMWVPLASLPAVFVSGMISTFTPSERRARTLFRPFAWMMVGSGAVGTFFHLRGVARQMGGFRNWKYNVITGPPFPAPMQVALTGLLGTAAAAPPAPGEKGRLARWIHAINALAYPLLAIEAGYNHWTGGFFNKLMWVPVTLGPFLAGAHLARLAGSRLGRSLLLPFSALAAVFGMVGSGFHLRNLLRRPGGVFWTGGRKGLNWQNLFYGAPLMAPLQMTAQGLLGLLVSLLEEER